LQLQDEGLPQRWALGLEYDGSGYAGWQLQDGPRTIQGELEAALSAVADVPIRVIVAGRTDAGVHALCQVVHFDSPVSRPEIAWVRGCNRFLPTAVSVRWAKPVPADFHARFSATQRSYRYLILNRPERPALFADRVTWVAQALDHERMAEAAQLLLGTHDFSAFRAAGCQAKSPVRTLSRFAIERQADMLIATLEANAFLHHMVRNLMGTLLLVGRGERPVAWVEEVLTSRDRSRAGMTAPPDGLYFHSVVYPDRFPLPGCPSIFGQDAQF
jgi:tRNA pseudouridine38-40 synthase